MEGAFSIVYLIAGGTFYVCEPPFLYGYNVKISMFFRLKFSGLFFQLCRKRKKKMKKMN